MSDFKKFEEALMGHLTNYKLGVNALKKYSSAIVELRKKDIKIEKVWRYGMPDPNGIFRADGVGVRSRILVKDLAKLNDIFRIRDIHSIEVFPLGIITPELLEVKFKIGEELR